MADSRDLFPLLARFAPDDAVKHIVAADSAKLREKWARFANKALDDGLSHDTAVDSANTVVLRALRRRKTTLAAHHLAPRKGRR